MSKHTPGPWMADGWDEIEEGVPIIAVHEENGLRSPTRGMVAWCSTIGGAAFESPGRAYANARLIASAPELLEALKAMVMHAESPDFDGAPSDAALAQAIAAIAKATGAQP